MRFGYVLAIVVVLVPHLLAQEPVPTSATLYILQSADPSSPPFAQATYPISASEHCGFSQFTLPTEPPVNPKGAQFVDPFTPAKFCFLPLPAGIPYGMGYRALVTVTATPCTVELPQSCESAKVSESVSLETFAVQPQAVVCAGQVVLDIGDWTRSVPVKGLARVQFSLLRSAGAVTAIRLSTRPQGGTFSVMDAIAASDLRRISGAYFSLPQVPGRYDLLVTAENSDLCTAGSDRPMTVEVTK